VRKDASNGRNAAYSTQILGGYGDGGSSSFFSFFFLPPPFLAFFGMMICQ
jgi:hypothetical protein